jgi:L-ribulose-5-phosphate 3-epimerase
MPIGDLEIGVMFWAGPDPLETVRKVKALGVRAGQMGLAGDYSLAGMVTGWKKALEDEDFTVVTVFCAYSGESYADIPTVKRTVGFIPAATRAEREQRTLEASDFAAALGIKSIATHIGFVPEDHSDPDYIAVREMVRRICDHAAANGQTFALETGQEPAPVLLSFLRDCGRANLKINFDPANMILYGTGDPIQALGMLAAHVVSVHCKDGVWPDKSVPGALGCESPLGKGAVGVEQFVGKLKAVGYTGILSIEREIEDPEARAADIRMAVGLLQRLKG